MKKLIIITILALICINVFSQDLIQSHAMISGFSDGKAIWGDIDNDNDLDLLICGSDGSGPITKLYRNDGNDVFTDLNIKIPALTEADADWGDFNADGYLDILISGWTGQACFAAIYLNNGEQKFIDIHAGLVGLRKASVNWVDYDNDGDLDIFYCGENENLNHMTFLYENRLENSFFLSDILIPGIQNAHSSWADYDNDMDMDLFIAGSGFSYIYKNDGGDFYNWIEVGPKLTEWQQIGFIDYDSDGDQDLFMLGMDSRLIVNEGNDSFSSITGIFPKVDKGSFCWGDFDLDGLADVVISAESGMETRTCLYLNKGNRTFTKSEILLPELKKGITCMADVDNDFDLDILLAGQTDSGLVTNIYYNNSIFSNAVPRVPNNLKSEVNDHNVVLSWDASSDFETPAEGLTYNIIVEYLVGPMSNTTNGFRRVVKTGNAGNNTGWKLNNLSTGIYIWNVQAIDNSYMGSKFLTNIQGLKKTFTIGNINSILEDTDPLINIYPNPAESFIHINSENRIPDRIEIYSVTGSQVMEIHHPVENGIDISGLDSGQYLMILYTKDEVCAQQFIKK